MLRKFCLLLVVPVFLAACAANAPGPRDEFLQVVTAYNDANAVLVEVMDAGLLDAEQARVAVAASDAGLIALRTARTALETYEASGGSDTQAFQTALAALSELSRHTGEILAIVALVEGDA